MKITKTLTAIIEDAAAAGFTIRQSESSVEIFKASKAGRIIRGLTITEVGAYRMDIALELAGNIKTRKDQRQVLGI
jgi:hypothetical protein